MTSAPYDTSVFINCPFDTDYKPLFRATMFAVHDSGFVARSALEVDDGAEVRISKIERIIRACRFGIHDISRVELDPTSHLPRFNMPLELGLFLGAKAFGDKKVQQRKGCLILDREQYRYQSFCSDIAGQDIRAHGGESGKVVKIVRDWLNSAANARGSTVVIPSGGIIAQRLAAYFTALPGLCSEQSLLPEELTFNDEVWLITLWLRGHPWGAATS